MKVQVRKVPLTKYHTAIIFYRTNFYQVRIIIDIIFLYLQMDNRFDGLTSGLQQQRSNPPLLGNHAARLEQFGMRFDDLNRIRVLGLYRISSIYNVAILNTCT